MFTMTFISNHYLQIKTKIVNERTLFFTTKYYWNYHKRPYTLYHIKIFVELVQEMNCYRSKIVNVNFLIYSPAVYLLTVSRKF